MIEVKKSNKADLERKRPLRLLMGMAMAIVLFVVAMEYSVNGNNLLYDPDFLDEIAEDMEFIPPLEIVKPSEEEEVKKSDQLEIVEEVYENEELEEEEESKTELSEEEEVPDDILDELMETVQIEEIEEDDVKDPDEVDALPVFPGSFILWFYQNAQYPESVQNDKVQGKVIFTFVVNEDGSVSDAKILRSVDPRLSNEALRVIRQVPKWQPGIFHRKPCKTRAQFQATFPLL